jgi:O-succinylbenzoic acid--CoA ligase
MSMWSDLQPGHEIRYEAHYGDRVVPCFAERPADLHRMIAATAAANPDAPALIGEEGEVTYSELMDRTARIAGGLLADGIQPGDRVALLMGNRFAFVETFVACQRIGAVSVPLNPLQKAQEIAYAVNQCGASALIHDATFAPNLPAPADVPTLRLRYSAYGADNAFEALRDADPADPIPRDEEETATLLYTSGTTGRPKGAMLTHLSIIHSSLHFAYSMEMAPGDRNLMAVPASHVTGLIANITTSLASGAAVVFLREFKADRCLKLIEQARVTHTLIVPAMYKLFLMNPDFDSFDLSSWRVGGYGGAPMPESTIAEMARRAPHIALMNGYGATEATSPTTMMPAHHTAAHSDSVGGVLHCAEIRIMDENGVELPPGEKGEIWMRGAHMVPGYWNNPEANKANFVGGYWKSGDIGAMDAEGFVYVLDRAKDMLNRGGYKVFSVEVENQLSFHPEIVECAIIAKPCPVLGERVRAIVVPRGEGSPALAEQIRAFAAERLSDYKVPEEVIFRDRPLPRNPNGKVIKTALREEYKDT